MVNHFQKTYVPFITFFNSRELATFAPTKTNLQGFEISLREVSKLNT